jgi:AcrR family transcriptional regulator
MARKGLVETDTAADAAVHDTATRARLLATAARLFAENGFAKVTVRDICRRARANVAAVNYHFGGKLGLYHEVMQLAIREMQATTDAAREAGERQPPEEQLRAYIDVFVRRVVGSDQSNWIHQLVRQEIADPTPAFDLVMQQAFRPRLDYLFGVIAKLIGCSPEDPRVARCAMSVQVQCLALLHNPMAAKISPAFERTPDTLDAMADHIARFSLAGIRALRA